MLETLLDVHLALLPTDVDRVNLLLHRRKCQLHSAHAALKCSQSLQYMSIAGILLWRWRSILRRRCHIKYCYMDGKGLWNIIQIITPQLGVRLH